MLRYKAGYKFVDGGVHAQVLRFFQLSLPVRPIFPRHATY